MYGHLKISGTYFLLFKSYKFVKTNFPTLPDTHDISWLDQTVFYNNNFSRKYPNNYRTTFLTTFFGITDTYHKLKVIDFYSHNTFITHNELNTSIKTKIHALQYSIPKFQIT